MLRLFCEKCGKEINGSKKYRRFRVIISRLLQYPIDKNLAERTKESEFDICEDCLPGEMKQDELGTDFEVKGYFLKGLK